MLPDRACKAYQTLGRGCQPCNDMAVPEHDRLRAGAEPWRQHRSWQYARPCSKHIQHHTYLLQCNWQRHPCSIRDKQGQVLPKSDGTEHCKVPRQQFQTLYDQERSSCRPCESCGRCNHCDSVTRRTAEGSGCCCLPTLMTTAVTDLSLQK